MHAEYARAIDDIFAGACHWRMWARLGWQEVRRRYRRTVIGPFWTTLSLGIFVLSLSVVWAKLWNQPVATYLPFVSAGIITWTLVSALITDGCLNFVANEGLIKQLQISFTLLVISTVWRNVIVFFHNIAILAFVFVILRQPPGPALLLVLPGLFLLCLNGAWMGLIFGMACARYRDLQQLVARSCRSQSSSRRYSSCPNSSADGRMYFVELNPLYHLIDIVRAPLLSTVPSATTWLCAVRTRCHRVDGDTRSVRAVQATRRLLAVGAWHRSQLSNLTLEFPIYGAQRSLRKQLFHAATGGLIVHGGRHERRVAVRALDRLNLSIEHGDRLG